MKYKRTKLLFLFPLAYLLTLLSLKNDVFTQWYTVEVYPKLSVTINTITSVFPFSLMEIFLIIALLFIPGYMIFNLVKFIKNKSARKSLLFKCLLNTLSCISVLYFLFVMFSGINYHRRNFAQTIGLVSVPSNEADLIALCEELTLSANTLRSQLGGISTTKLENFDEMAQESVITYSKFEKGFPNLFTKYGAPKPVICSKIMSYLDITGIFFPYTFEANINIDAPSFLIPATMLHELSHVQGYMKEDEANFIAYLASSKSDNTYFKYSGVMLAYIYASNALYAIDSNAHLAITQKLSSDVKNDLIYNNYYWQQFDTPFSTLSNTFNDAYLKINSQSDGVRSYGRMTDLLIADYKMRHPIQ